MWLARPQPHVESPGPPCCQSLHLWITASEQDGVGCLPQFPLLWPGVLNKHRVDKGGWNHPPASVHSIERERNEVHSVPQNIFREGRVHQDGWKIRAVCGWAWKLMVLSIFAFHQVRLVVTWTLHKRTLDLYNEQDFRSVGEASLTSPAKKSVLPPCGSWRLVRFLVFLFVFI